MSGISVPRPTMVVSAPKRKLRLCPQTVLETIACSNGTSRVCEYVWGPDLSGTLQGAGGVGGLLAVLVSENTSTTPDLSTSQPSTFQPYFPCYDNNGNVTSYLDANGNTVAAYTYDAFGRTLSATGPLANLFPHRFSTKYFDPGTCLYYYGYRFYHPVLMRWINRDQIAEEGGVNLYQFSNNNGVSSFDILGLDRYIEKFDLVGIRGTKANWLRSQPHVGVAVDLWKKVKTGDKNCCYVWVWKGVLTFDFKLDYTSLQSPLALLPVFGAKGMVIERSGMQLHVPQTISSHPNQDAIMLDKLRNEVQHPRRYNIWTFNCIYWAWNVIDFGLNSNPDNSSCSKNPIRRGKHVPTYPSL